MKILIPKTRKFLLYQKRIVQNFGEHQCHHVTPLSGKYLLN